MSFGGFKFGNSTSSQLSAPQLSVTNPTPGSTPSSTTTPFTFGSNSASTSSQPAPAAGGGLFGSLGQNQGQQQQQQQPTGGSLFSGFGAKPPATTSTGTTGTGGSLFSGLGGGQQQQQQQPAATGGGLFGSLNQPQQQSSGQGLFGSTSQPQAQQQQQQPTNGLLGSIGQPQQQTGSTGLFGSTNQPQQSIGGGLFGSTSQPQQGGLNNSLFGSTSQPQQNQSSSLFGQTAPAQNQQVGTLQTSVNASATSGGINKTTRFADLPEQAQKYIEQMDTAIKAQKAAGSGMNIEGLGRAIWQTSMDVKAANEEYSAIAHTLKSISTSLSQLRDKMITEGRDVERVKEIWDVYRSAEGRVGQVRLGAYREFPQEFFSKVAVGMEERVGRYKKTIAQLNRAIISLSSEHQSSSPQAIAQTIQNHQQAMLALAAQLDGLQLRMNSLRAAFAEEWREKTGSVRDPFEIAREERAVRA